SRRPGRARSRPSLVLPAVRLPAGFAARHRGSGSRAAGRRLHGLAAPVVRPQPARPGRPTARVRALLACELEEARDDSTDLRRADEIPVVKPVQLDELRAVHLSHPRAALLAELVSDD